MLNLIFKMQNLSDFSYFLLNIRKVLVNWIFWRIFMRQISLADYFCKGLILPYLKNCPQHALNFFPEPQMQACFIVGSATVGSIKYQYPSILTNVDSSWWHAVSAPSWKWALNSTWAWRLPMRVWWITSNPSQKVPWLHFCISSWFSRFCWEGTVVATI